MEAQIWNWRPDKCQEKGLAGCWNSLLGGMLWTHLMQEILGVLPVLFPNNDLLHPKWYQQAIECLLVCFLILRPTAPDKLHDSSWCLNVLHLSLRMQSHVCMVPFSIKWVIWWWAFYTRRCTRRSRAKRKGGMDGQRAWSHLATSIAGSGRHGPSSSNLLNDLYLQPPPIDESTFFTLEISWATQVISTL